MQPPKSDPKQARLLVVDDSQAIRRTIAHLLVASGYWTGMAASGEEAFQRCLNEPFDLVISDVTMGALSGMQLCRLLRSDPYTANLPVVLLTARDDPRSRFWGRHAGARAYVTKEQMQEQLLPTVREILESVDGSVRPAAEVRRQPTKPLERLSQVLDDLLFRAVVASDVRSLVESAKDRHAFQQAVVNLAGEVTDFGYLLFVLEQGDTPTYAVLARESWPDTLPPLLIETLQLPMSEEPWHIQGPTEARTPRLDVNLLRRFTVEAAGERLGELIAWSEHKRLAARDEETLAMLAHEIGVVAKTVFLMEETRRLAYTDQLTQLPNRHRTADQLADELGRARRYGTPLSVMLCDVDHFKKVNDTFGHNVGDEVLKRVASTLAATVRKVDIAARWGGEEFLVLLPSTAVAGARVVAERIRQQVQAMTPVEGGPEQVTMSIGLAAFRDDASPEGLLERADQALYRAKQRGRNRVETDSGGRAQPETERPD